MSENSPKIFSIGLYSFYWSQGESLDFFTRENDHNAIFLKWYHVVGFVLAVLFSCFLLSQFVFGGAGSSTPVSENPFQETIAITPTVTPTNTPTATLAPTRTPRPTATPVPTSTPVVILPADLKEGENFFTYYVTQVECPPLVSSSSSKTVFCFTNDRVEAFKGIVFVFPYGNALDLPWGVDVFGSISGACPGLLVSTTEKDKDGNGILVNPKGCYQIEN